MDEEVIAVSEMRVDMKRAFGGLLVLWLVASVFATSPVRADHEVEGDRISGTDRYDTAALLAAVTYPRGTATALVVRADQFADALAGSYAAGLLDAPVLLSDQAAVPDRTWRALESLGVTQIVLLGGRAALSESVESELRARGYDVERVEGVDRFQTAAAVANRFGQEGTVGELDGMRTAIVAYGGGFADALAAGPLAAGEHFPLMLTERDQTNVALNSVLDQLDIEQIIIVGGVSAVSAAVEDEFRERGFHTLRVSGANRTETAANIAELARSQLGWEAGLVLLGRGNAFPDALAAAPYGGARRAPVILAAAPDVLSEQTELWLMQACPEIMRVRALGGTAAVSDAVIARASDAAGRCHAPEDRTYLVSPDAPQSTQAGGTFDLVVEGRFDDAALEGPLDLALFACRNVDTLARPRVFQDAQADGFADGIGTSNTGSARISSMHGQATQSTYLTGARPNSEGTIPFSMTAGASDCAVVVVFADSNGNNRLNVDSRGRPTEPFGLVRLIWR